MENQMETAQKNKKGFYLFVDALNVLEHLSIEQKATFIDSIYYYQLYKELPSGLDFAMKMILFPFINQFIRDDEKYNNYGERHWNWKGGKTPENLKIRQSAENKSWRRSVFERDEYICQGCGQVGAALHAHHIKPFAKFPELRFDVDNGLTLCVACHRKEHAK